MLNILMSNGTEIGILVGVIIFILLFMKLVMSFIRLLFRHPFWFILLLAVGGLGLAFNVLLAGIIIVAVLVGGVVVMLLNGFDL